MSGVEEVTGSVAAMDMNGGAAAAAPAAGADGEQVVTPWDVEGGADGKIDYAKLVNDFGCSTVDEAGRRTSTALRNPTHAFKEAAAASTRQPRLSSLSPHRCLQPYVT